MVTTGPSRTHRADEETAALGRQAASQSGLSINGSFHQHQLCPRPFLLQAEPWRCANSPRVLAVISLPMCPNAAAPLCRWATEEQHRRAVWPQPHQELGFLSPGPLGEQQAEPTSANDIKTIHQRT